MSLSILYSVKGSDAGNGIRIFVPDILMFIASLVTWLVCRNIVQKQVQENLGEYNAQFENEDMVCVYIYSLIIRGFFFLVCLTLGMGFAIYFFR